MFEVDVLRRQGIDDRPAGEGAGLQHGRARQFQQRLQQLEGRARGLEGDMQCSQLIAMRDFDRQVSPIVQSVMGSRGAGIVIDASNTTSFDPNFEITATVIQQLDQNQNTRVANVARHAASECQAPAGQAPAQ